MNRNIRKLASLFLVAAGILVLFSCATPGPPGVEQVAVVQTSDSVIVVDTFTATVTVGAIDTAKRKVTLVDANGRKTTYKAGPEVVNFDQIKTGDQVKVVLTEEAAVYIGRGAPPGASNVTGVALAPVGAKPGGVLVDTVQMTAKVTDVDTKKRKVTYELPDGSTKTVKVSKQVDLADLTAGDNVTVRVTEGLAISVEKP